MAWLFHKSMYRMWEWTIEESIRDQKPIPVIGESNCPCHTRGGRGYGPLISVHRIDTEVVQYSAVVDGGRRSICHRIDLMIG